MTGVEVAPQVHFEQAIDIVMTEVVAAAPVSSTNRRGERPAPSGPERLEVPRTRLWPSLSSFWESSLHRAPLAE